MRDVMSEHAERVGAANLRLLNDLEAMEAQAKNEIAATLAEFASAAGDMMRRLSALTEAAASAAADALAANLMAVAASEAALRNALDARLAFLDTGRLPEREEAQESLSAMLNDEPEYPDAAPQAA